MKKSLNAQQVMFIEVISKCPHIVKYLDKTAVNRYLGINLLDTTE